MAETPQEVLKMIQDHNIELIDLKFVDMLGIWQHCTFHRSLIDEDSFTDGVAFDGSSIRGWKAIPADVAPLLASAVAVAALAGLVPKILSMMFPKMPIVFLQIAAGAGDRPCIVA